MNISKCVVDQKCKTYSNAECLLRLKVVLRVAVFRSAREPRSALLLPDAMRRRLEPGDRRKLELEGTSRAIT